MEQVIPMLDFQYEKESSQPYQYRILVYECNGLLGSQIIELFRNDHLIEINPNIIIGTLNPEEKYIGDLNVNLLIDLADQPVLNSTILESDIIVFPLCKKNMLQLEHLLKLLKCMKLKKKKRIICLSDLNTWVGRHSEHHKHGLRKEDLFRRCSTNFTLKELENLCIGIHHFNPDVVGFVIGCGIVYGHGEHLLFEHFKRALEQERLKIYGRGTNRIPTIHVQDLCQLAYQLAFESSFTGGLEFAADHSHITQRELLEGIAKVLGNGEVDIVPIEDGFLDNNFNILTADIHIDDKSLPELKHWHCRDGILNNMPTIVSEFNIARGLRPNKILIHGVPVGGKSRIAEMEECL